MRRLVVWKLLTEISGEPPASVITVDRYASRQPTNQPAIQQTNQGGKEAWRIARNAHHPLL